MKIHQGERIGKQGKLRLGCTATIFDSTRSKLLLTRRADNGQWCLPGGGVEPGESVAEACLREIREEAGLDIRIVRLVGVYSNPHRLIEYGDGNRVQIVALNFEAEIINGEPILSDETTAVGYFARAGIDALDLILIHRERIVDIFENAQLLFIR